MAGYLSSRKLTNVKGRIKYMTDPGRQENIADYYNTTDNEFWAMLAKENQIRHKEAKAGGKCCEARELIIGIPQDSKITAKEICDIFKTTFGVECTCAIHENNRKEIKNRHCHLIFSEREKLSEPETTEEKRATRTYYYDKKGNKCPKAEAVKVVKKGTILKEGITRYFTNKNDFFKSEKFIMQCKEKFLKDTFGIDWSFQEDKQNKELAEKHIGKNNPKSEYIKQNNKLKAIVKNVCKAGDFIADSKGATLNELKKGYEISSFTTANFEENENKVYDFVEEMQSIYKVRVRNEVKAHNQINSDLRDLQIKDNSFVYKQIQDMVITNYEPETKTRNKPKVIEFLKDKLVNMFERIKKLVDFDFQDLLYIEPKNRIELTQDKRTDKLYIKDDNYLREQKEKEYDEPELQ